MRIKINRDECQGHARCASISAELFILDDQGYIATDGFDVPPGKEGSVRAAAQACPERVITILDDGPSEKG